MSKCKYCDGDGIVEVVSRTKPNFYMPCHECNYIPGIEPVRMGRKRLKEIASRNYRDGGMTHDLLKHICWLTVQWKVAEKTLKKGSLGELECLKEAVGEPMNHPVTEAPGYNWMANHIASMRAPYQSNHQNEWFIKVQSHMVKMLRNLAVINVKKGHVEDE